VAALLLSGLHRVSLTHFRDFFGKLFNRGLDIGLLKGFGERQRPGLIESLPGFARADLGEGACKLHRWHTDFRGLGVAPGRWFLMQTHITIIARLAAVRKGEAVPDFSALIPPHWWERGHGG